MEMNIGINENERKAAAEGLARLLADSYTLYLKTHNFHWNVTGPLFNTLHLLFEQQYTELALAVDEIAERIRALGLPAPGSYAEFGRLTTVKEAQSGTNAHDMLLQLIADQGLIIQTARGLFPMAEQARDQVTLDLLTRRMQVHEKNAWMLRSSTSG